MRSAASVGALEWLEGLELFGVRLGLERMHALLGALGDPEHAYPAVHVVGTNGKTTTTRMIEALLRAEGLRVGTFTSPHVTSWSERIRVDGREVDVETALGRVRTAAEAVGATQFEVITAAALAEFAAAGVDVAVVEAGLGGRLDATNVLASRVVVLTNVALEHTEHLGETREAIAAEKLAVARAGATIVLGEPEWEPLGLAMLREATPSGSSAPRGSDPEVDPAGRVVVAGSSNLALALAAAESFLGRPVDPKPGEAVRVPGRLEVVAERPTEIWDGAHNLAAVGYLLPRLPRRPDGYVLVLSILDDKDARGMLAAFSAVSSRLVATTSEHPRGLTPEALSAAAEPYFEHVETVADPFAARARARELAGPAGAVLVSGSLYLLLALAAVRSGYVP